LVARADKHDLLGILDAHFLAVELEENGVDPGQFTGWITASGTGSGQEISFFQTFNEQSMLAIHLAPPYWFVLVSDRRQIADPATRKG
jgi:hypothetical protein